MRIAVAGGTGLVGRHVIEAAQSRGHEAVPLARSRGVDLMQGTGLEGVLEGVDAVIDTLNIDTLSGRRAVEFFEATTRHLLAAERSAGVGHHIALSIVGIDRIDASYYAGKLAQERQVAASDVPHTIARASQFHEFAGQIAARASVGPLTLVPRMPTRPVSAEDVGSHLVDVAEAGPVGRAADLVGPREETLGEMVRRLYAATGVRRRIVELRFPGAYGRGLASGSLRGSAGALTGRMTFEEWLRSQHR